MHKLSLAIGLVWCGLAMATGCNGPLSPQAQQMLQNGYDAYQAGNDQQAVEALDSFLADNARSSRADEAYYIRGLARQRQQDPQAAKNDLNAAIAATENKDLRGKSLVALGEIAFEEGDLAVAESTYRQALVDIEPGQPPSDHAHYRLGTVLQRQGRWDEADVQFDRVVHYFGGTRLGQLAGRRTHCTAWAIQTGAFNDRDRAEAAEAMLREQSIDAEARTILHEAQPLFVVQVGRYATYDQALAALPGVQVQAKDAFVVPTP